MTERLAALRASFDGGFAAPPAPAAGPTEDLLAIGLGGAPHALRLGELAGLFADRRITPVPSRAPALLGLAGFRGAIVPVYDLRRLLGQPTDAAPRWLVIAAARPVGFAFDRFDGHLRLAPDAIAAGPGGALVAGPPPRPIIALEELLAAVARPRAAAPSQES